MATSPLAADELPSFDGLLRSLDHQVALQKKVDVASEKIVNGVDTHGYGTTAALLYSGSGNVANNGGLYCTATLIGCRTILTAAHCVEEDANPARYAIYLQHAGVFQVSTIAVHPSYSFPRADIAVLTLSQAVQGVPPTPINSGVDPRGQPGAQGLIAGFGQTSGNGNDYGIKRAGKVNTLSCNSESDLDDRYNVCWRFQSPIGAAGEDSNTCNGDSGGPLFMDLGQGQVVAGVTSGGSSDSCGAGDFAFDTNVYAYRSFVQSRLGGDSTQACGNLPAPKVVGRAGILSSGQSTTFTFTVGSGSKSLRFGLNGEDNGSLDVDLYVRKGSSVSTSNADCQASGAGNFGACNFANAGQGTWSVMVRAKKGSGQFQLTGTSFGSTLTASGGDDGGGDGGGGDGGGDGGGPSGPSCAGECGGTPDGSCWCDELCQDYGDCCGDYANQCTGTGGGGGDGGGGPSCTDLVCDEDPYCCQVEWDEICDEVADDVC